MTRKKNSSIEMKKIREKIDSIDSRILPLMVTRASLVSQALALKKKKTDIIDRKRINQIKKKLSLKAKKLGGNPKLISKIWESIIRNFIDYEKKHFKK